MIQPNVAKQGLAHEDLVNDEQIEDAPVLAIQELQARMINGCLLTTPMEPHRWVESFADVQGGYTGDRKYVMV